MIGSLLLEYYLVGSNKMFGTYFLNQTINSISKNTHRGSHQSRQLEILQDVLE